MHAWIVVLILFASLGLVVFCYVGYPLLMMAMARSQARPVQASDWLPSVDVIVAVHNASDSVIAKIDNLLALDYPVDRLHLRIGSDGSDDDTVEQVHAYLTRHSLQSRVSIAEFAQRRGKSACLADLIAQSDADIVFFTDVRQRIESCALKALVRPLADPMIGAVSGELMFENADGFAAS
ncbi:MAG: glycosyltransferase, partial [Dokdonella sp.]